MQNIYNKEQIICKTAQVVMRWILNKVVNQQYHCASISEPFFFSLQCHQRQVWLSLWPTRGCLIKLQSSQLDACVHSSGSNGLCGAGGGCLRALQGHPRPRYRSVYCNVKYHCTLEDMAAQFCQGLLEYFFLISPAAGGQPLVAPLGLFCFCFIF